MRMRHLAVALAGSLLLSLAACREAGQPHAAAPGAETAAGPAGGGAARDPAKLDGEIARLERQAERNPADDEARAELAQAYVSRAAAHHAAGRLPDALADYRRALRLDPDNEAAQKNVADIAPQVEGTPQEGEYGEPPPLPITPNVTEGEGRESPTPTPRQP